MAYNNYGNSRGGYYGSKNNGNNNRREPQPRLRLSHAVAPYNFIPFPEEVVVRYNSIEELPGHDVIDPNLKSGEIHVTFTADTPVLVAGEQQNGKPKCFCRGTRGEYMIPGSTIKGMIRRNMQILGVGLVQPGEDLEDGSPFFREVGSAKASMANKRESYYETVLGVNTAHRKTTATKVKTGCLRKVGKGYQIQPCINAEYIPVKRSEFYYIYMEKYENDCAKAIRVSYIPGKDSQGVFIDKMKEGWNAAGGMKNGYLLLTGRHVGKLKNQQYVFSEANERAKPIVISQEDVLLYQVDYEARKNALKGRDNEDEKFWALPEKEGKDGEKPVFYVQYNGHVYFGMTQFLRIPYPKRFSDGLPEQHRKLWKSEKTVLDLPHAILGFANDRDSYRSRVSFSDFTANSEAKELPPVNLMLQGPKPSFYAGYTEDGEPYIDDFALRGYKQYWLKDPVNPGPTGQNGNIESQVQFLDKGAVFTGVIRFKNLYPEELGLLLWSLRLDKDCYQQIGMAKPYGYGRVKPHIDAITEFDPSDLYSAGNAAGITHTSSVVECTVEDYIQIYKDYLDTVIDEPDAVYNIFDDFFYMCETIRTDTEEIRYMKLGGKNENEYSNLKKALPTVRRYRNGEVEPVKKEYN